jgi:DNA-binding beta-propeller fold protein YncE
MRTGYLALALVGTLVVGVERGQAAGVQITAVRQIGGSGHAGLYGWGAATMLDGSVLIGDYWNYRIVRYAKDGTPLGTVVPPADTHKDPYGIGVDPTNGDIYFGDVDGAATVDKYSAEGRFLLQFGAKGTGPNRFTYPSRVAVASDRTVYVADSLGATVSAHDPQGVERFSVSGSRLREPRSLAVDAADRIYVADAGLRLVQVFDRNLNWLASFGSGLLKADLRGIAVDKAHGWVYVVDAGASRVYKFTTAGQLLLSFGGEGTGPGQFSGGGRDLTVDGDGNVWVGDMPNFRVQKFSPSGQFLDLAPDPPEPPPPGGFNEPRAVGVDAQGNVFVADTQNWRIQKFDATGAFSLQWGSRGTRGTGTTKFNYPKGLAVDRSTGAVYVCDTDNGQIKKYDNNGAFIWQVNAAKGSVGADVAPNGSLWVVDTVNARILQFDATTGAKLRTIGSRGSGNGQFQYPTGVAVDTDGSIWVTDTTRDTVQHLSATGAYLGKVASTGTAVSQLQQGWDVEVLGNNVLVSDAATDQVKVWTKQGAFVTAFGGTGTALGQFQNPKGMDLTPDGRLFVEEQLGERVQELRVSLS